MFIFGNFIIAVATVLDYVLVFYMWVIIIQAVLSWVSPDPYNPIVRAIHNLTEPVLGRIRRTLPVLYGGFDFSPIVVFLAIIFLQKFLVNSMFVLGGSLR